MPRRMHLSSTSAWHHLEFQFCIPFLPTHQSSLIQTVWRLTLGSSAFLNSLQPSVSVANAFRHMGNHFQVWSDLYLLHYEILINQQKIRGNISKIKYHLDERLKTNVGLVFHTFFLAQTLNVSHPLV